MARGRLAEEEAIARDLDTDDEDPETEMASHSRKERNLALGIWSIELLLLQLPIIGTVLLGERAQNMEQHRGRAALEPSGRHLHGGSSHSQLHSTATTLLEVEQVTATVRLRLGPSREKWPVPLLRDGMGNRHGI